jgi:hypothetical protein
MRSVRLWVIGALALLGAGAGPAEEPGRAPGPALAWQLSRAQLGGPLAFAQARDGDFDQVSIRPDLEFLGWDGRTWRAEYLGGGQFYLYEPDSEVPIRVTELHFLDWQDQQCAARLEHGEFTIVKPPRPAPPPPSAATATAGGVQIQAIPIQNPPLVYRGLRVDYRSPSGHWSAVLANPSGLLAPPPGSRDLLPGPPTEVLPEPAALAMATAQMTKEQMLARIQEEIDRSRGPEPQPPPAVPVRACFFAEKNFAGASLCVNAGQSQRDLAKVRDTGVRPAANFAGRISSVRIDGGPAQVTLYAEPELAGASEKLVASSPDLAVLQWSDRARSLEVDSLEPPLGAGDPGVAYFFSDEGYQGYLFQVRAGDPGIADLRPSGHDDAIASVRVEGDAKVALYGDLYYRGREWSTTQGSTSLAVTDAFDHRASSLQVVRASQPEVAPAQAMWTILQAPNGDWTKAHRDTAINYITWGGGEWTASYLGGGRFLHTQRGSTQSRESIGLNYIDWKGTEWTATVEGEKFRHTRRDGHRDEVDRAVNYQTWGGEHWSAKLLAPAPGAPR